MYRAYWNMEFDPFSKEIDMKKLFKTNDFNEALTRLEFLNTTKGIGLFTGNPGSGKTYAIKYFLDNLNPNLYKVVYLPLTTISVMDFYQALAICLGLETGRSKTKLFFDILLILTLKYTKTAQNYQDKKTNNIKIVILK